MLLVAKWPCLCAWVHAHIHGTLSPVSGPGSVLLHLSRRHLVPPWRKVLQQCLKSRSKQCRTKKDCALHDNSAHFGGALQTLGQRTAEAWWTDTGKANITWWVPSTIGHSWHFPLYISRNSLGTLKQLYSLFFSTRSRYQFTPHY